MPRLVSGSNTHRRIESQSLFEKDFERLILRYKNEIFPDFLTVPFAPYVQYQGVRKQPDLALIERNSLARWWVVEVEMARHSLEAHVAPQVEVFCRGTYDMSHARALDEQIDHIDFQDLATLVMWEPPRVLVVADRPVPTWERDLGRLGASIMSVEVFPDHTGGPRDPYLLISGNEPKARGDVVAECYVDPALPRYLRVTNAGIFAEKGQIEIELDGEMTLWELIQTAEDAWLNPRGSQNWSVGRKFQIVMTTNGRFEFKEV